MRKPLNIFMNWKFKEKHNNGNLNKIYFIYTNKVINFWTNQDN